MKIKLTCKNCKKDFYVIKSRKDAKFCCKECYTTYNHGKNNGNYKGGKVKTICKQCGNKFYDHVSQNRIFCSSKCYAEWQSENRIGKNHHSYNQITLICEWCGSKYTRNKASVDGSHFCCQNCYSKAQSASKRNIPYDEWESFAGIKNYCPLFDEVCRESNREKYNRRCFLCNKLESKNITSTGKQYKLSVHHVDMNKQQGCKGVRWKLVPLCMNCHNLGHREIWIGRITWLLMNNIYNKEEILND